MKRKKRNYWTKEKCLEESKKYYKKSDFKYKSPGAFNASLKNNWVDELCSHMVYFGNRYKRLIYVYEFSDKSIYVGLTYNIKERDEKHKRDVKSSVYKHIKKIEEIPSLTFSNYFFVDEAKVKEKEKIEYYKKKGYNILNIAKAGGIGGCLKWTFEKCKEESLKYKTKKEFYKNNNSAYNSAIKNNWLDILCNHMKTKKVHKFGYWTKEKCREESEKFKTRTELYKKSTGAYNAMLKNGWLDELCFDLKTKKKNGYWTKDLCKKEALKYKNKTEFAKNSGGAYRTMIYNKWTDFVCSHMKKNKYGNINN